MRVLSSLRTSRRLHQLREATKPVRTWCSRLYWGPLGGFLTNSCARSRPSGPRRVRTLIIFLLILICYTLFLIGRLILLKWSSICSRRIPRNHSHLTRKLSFIRDSLGSCLCLTWRWSLATATRRSRDGLCLTSTETPSKNSQNYEWNGWQPTSSSRYFSELSNQAQNLRNSSQRMSLWSTTRIYIWKPSDI